MKKRLLLMLVLLTVLVGVCAPKAEADTVLGSNLTVNSHRTQYLNAAFGSLRSASCSHTGGTATCSFPAVCTACGQPYGETNPANHAKPNEFSYVNKGTTHTKHYACCGAKIRTEIHSYQNGLCPCGAAQVFEIVWKDGNGNILFMQEAKAGTLPAYGGTRTPTKAETQQHYYTWNGGWEPEVATVTGHATYTATFDAHLRAYDITWIVNGETSMMAYPYGEMPVYLGALPPCHTIRWNTAIQPVTGEATYTGTLVAAHSFTDRKSQIQASGADCENPEKYFVLCDNCDELSETVTVSVGEALGHSEVTDATVTATCTTSGKTEGKHCSVCHKVLVAQTTIPATGHTPGTPVRSDEVAPSCAADGSYVQTVSCSVCGTVISRQTVVVPALDHNYSSTVTAPTCTQQGYTTHVCAVCGASYVDGHTDALGHAEVTDAAIPATCTTPGKTEGKHCSRCGKVFAAQEVIPAQGHAWNAGEVTLEPTEQSTGIKTYTCTRCGETKTEVLPSLEHVHRFVPSVTAPTCTSQGYTTYNCPCGESYTDDFVDPLPHAEVLDPGTAASCMVPGKTEGSHCGVCGAVIRPQEEIPAPGHTWNAGEVTRQPTETSTGRKVYTCTVCGATREEILPVLDHVHRHTASVTAPTCTSQGYTTYTCPCGDSYVADYTDILPHTETRKPGFAPTCTAPGLTDGKECAVCGLVLVKQSILKATGHSWDSGVVTVPPTEQSAGIRTYTCTTCGQTKTEEIPALEHVHRHEAVVTAPTCTDQGYTTYTCPCGDSYTDNLVDALGHSYSPWAPTGNPGEESRTCGTCGDVETRVIPQGNCLIMDRAELGDHDSVWIGGAPLPVQKTEDTSIIWLPQGDSFYMQTYTFHVGDASDIHTHYPITMEVWYVEKGSDGVFTAERIEELDNILQYSGSSIRIKGVKGIRMITSMEKAKKNALVSDAGLGGFKLLEYGTVLSWASALDENNPLVLGPEYAKHNFAYKRDEADPVFAQTEDMIQYTNVLVGFTTEQCSDDIAMRPYIILEDAQGNEVTLYGGIVYRSIGYIAWQNRAAFRPNDAAYDYVWEIIHHVYGDKYDEEYKG